MKSATRFSVQPSWKLLILDLGFNPDDVLRLAGLPCDLFSRRQAVLSPEEYFSLWQGLEQVAGVEDLPLKLGQVVSVEAFDPAVFAALCSPNLNTALQRLAEYKRLIGPLTMDVDITSQRTRVTLSCSGTVTPIPRSLGTTELVFFTQLARLGTRERIVPLFARTPRLPAEETPYEKFFGCSLEESEAIEIAFSANDSARPFLTANNAMWTTFEASLKKRVSSLEEDARMSARVRAVLIEVLPAGITSMDAVAQRLAVSKRSLQRYLGEESLSYQQVLGQVRLELAQHYLTNSRLSPSEISWLLGFQESNSFIRVFRTWTGATPRAYREARAGDSNSVH